MGNDEAIVRSEEHHTLTDGVNDPQSSSPPPAPEPSPKADPMWPVHWSDYSGQPDIKLSCGGWTTPLYHEHPCDPPHPETYWGEPRADEDEGPVLYTFEDDLTIVTCEACRPMLRYHLANASDDDDSDDNDSEGGA